MTKAARRTLDPKVRELASWREAHLALDKMQREMERKEALEEGIQEGEKRGVKKGEKAGEVKGKRQLLLRLIEQRFGAITPQRLSRVESGDIDRMTARLFEAETFDDLFEEG